MVRGLSRRCAQRLSKKVKIRHELRELIAALNWMHCGDFDARPSGVAGPLHGEVVSRLHSLVEMAGDLGNQDHLPSQEAAFRELLHGEDGYAEPAVPASLAPFKLELISLPQDLVGAPRAEDLLDEDDRRYLEVQERMLNSVSREQDEVVKQPYWDPALKHNPRNYRKFIQKLNSIGYLEFTLSPSDHAGVFFVWKSDHKKIRMIVDARPANSKFRDPPGVSLSTAETFSKFEVEPSSSGEDSLPFSLFAGLSDVKDCFHRIKQPRWLSKHFCFMPIEARHVGLTGQFLEGHQLSSSDLVFPMPGSLCVGFTWSLYFAQRINEVMMSNVGSLGGSSLIHDRGGPAVFSRSESEVKHFVYVDNLGVLSSNRKAVEVGLAELSENFTQKNLLLHPGEIQHDRIKALGVELDGKRLVARLSCDRLHRVRQGLRYVLHRKKCSGRVLEILVGHCTYCGLMNRCVLSVFHNCYKFIRSNYYVPTPLWSSVASELRAFCGLMPLLRSEWSRPWNEVVTVSDASEEGFGVCADRLDRQAVASIGRVSERDRFRRSGGHSARESALTSAGFVKSEVTGQWAEGVLDDEEYLQLSGWDLDPRFPEISKDILQSTTWSTVRQGPWKKKEHIVHLEARALVKSMEFAVHDNLAASTRQLFLVDSMSAALAFDRCRSKNYRMLRQIRKFCSMSLARNISFSVRWVPSELNPADGPSRDSSQLISSAPQWRQDGSKEGGSFVELKTELLREPGFASPTLDQLSSHLPEVNKQKVQQESESTDSSSESPKKGARERRLQRRSRNRLKKYIHQKMESSQHGLTLLEQKAIGERASKYYNEEYQAMKSFAKSLGCAFSTPQSLDAMLTRYFNHLFLQGHPAHRGDKILASVMHHHPQYGRQGTEKLPHSWRSLKGWRRLGAGSSRKAYPLAIWAAICCEMKRKGYLQMALFTMMGLSSYARPGELLRCRVYSLVRPSPSITEFWTLLLNPEERAERSKVGEFDDSLALDSPYLRPWAFPLMKQLVNRSPELPLWCFDYSHYSKIFGQVVETLGLDMTPYQLRHSGPSIDRSRNLRSLLEVQKRGRWRSHKSVARYEKSARLAANFQSLSPALQHHCLLAEQLLGAVMLNRSPAPTPPSKPRA